MKTLVQKTALGLVLGATALTSLAAPAEAQRYGRYGYGHYGYRHHDDTGTAVVAGIAGLAIGAAIASNDRRYDYDRRYYRDHGYYPTDGYWYREHYRGYDYRGCYVRRQWDPYLHQRVMVRYCR